MADTTVATQINSSWTVRVDRDELVEFLVSYALDTPYPYDLLAGARGVLLAESALRSSREGRRVELPVLTLR